ncbi:MAG: nucleotidyltransferase domain-containing protein [Proteobacteria bacterium]|nr:nucleotidyltransferase domain-containing protein [Pseudomonadota bacterium]
MTEYHQLLLQPQYNFINERPELGKHIILLGLSGSISYGTNNAESDLDLRGIALNPKSDLIGLSCFEQYEDRDTDSVIYAFNKIVKLLAEGNPAALELLGLRADHYLILNDIGRALIENVQMFLSRRVIQTFGGYADAQLRRLQNALARDTYPQAEKELHIVNSVKHAIAHFNERYQTFEQGALHVYMDDAVAQDLEKEIFIDASLKHYPLRDYKNMLRDMETVIRGYDKLGNRNKKKDDKHLNKHAMHLIRLLLTGIDLLKHHRVMTWRGEDLDLLMSIRNGAFRSPDGMFKPEFYEMVEHYENEFYLAAETCALPDAPDMAEIERLVMSVNEKVVRNEI